MELNGRVDKTIEPENSPVCNSIGNARLPAGPSGPQKRVNAGGTIFHTGRIYWNVLLF